MTGSRDTRGLCAVLVFVLLASACGSSTETTTTDTPSSSSSQPSTFDSAAISEPGWAVAHALEDAHGAQGGLLALILGLERGYDIGQISEAAHGGTIDTDGVIAVAGGVVAPSGSRAGVTSLPGEDESEPEDALGDDDGQGVTLVSYGSAAQWDRLDLLGDLLFTAPPVTDEEPDAVVSAAITSLAASGYSLQQITDALTLQVYLDIDTIGQEDTGVGGIGACAALYTETGEIVAPQGSFQSGCSVLLDAPADSNADGGSDAPDDDADDQGEADADETSASLLQGSFGDYPFLAIFEGQPLSAILENQVTVDQAGDVPVVAGIYRYMAPPDHYAEASEVVCEFEGIVELVEGPIGDAVFDGSVWTGTVQFVGSQADGTCPASDIETEGNAGPGNITLTISSSGFTGSIDVDGLIWTIAGQPAG